MGYLWALISVVLASAAQLIMKWAMNHLPPLANYQAFFDTLLAVTPGAQALVLGLLAYGLSMGCWFMALRQIPLSKAYPLLSLSYILVWAAAIWLPQWREAFNLVKLAGVAMIVTGVLLITLPESKKN